MRFPKRLSMTVAAMPGLTAHTAVMSGAITRANPKPVTDWQMDARNAMAIPAAIVSGVNG
jgi:hypothetical protein